MLRRIERFFLSIFGLGRKLKPIKVFHTQVWYGRVNRWDKDMKLLSKELDLMEDSGVSGYLIEMPGCCGDKWTENWLKSVEKNYKTLLNGCRSRNLWLHVSISNDNMGSKKYGDSGKHTIASEMTWFKRLCKIVKENGPKNVVVQPVAETQTNGGKQFEDYCKTELKGFLTCYNGNSGHPSSTNGMTYFATHPSSIGTKNPQGALVVSDHGLIIRELNYGNSLDTHGDPAKISVWVKNCKAIGSPVVGFYAFRTEDLDKDAIRALGKAVR